MKLDILAIGVHPDDVELGCSGTLMKHIAKGYQVGILDLTRGELGTRGTAETRLREVEASSKIMGVQVRENLGFEDGFFVNDKDHQLRLIQIIRKYQPTILITNAKYDRHPDHGKSAQLTYDAAFLSGLSKIETSLNGEAQASWRPRALYNYIQAIHIEPAFVVDITDYYLRKEEAIRAFKTQFHDPESTEPATFISSPEFLAFVKARAVHFGVPIGVQYAEAFTINRIPGVEDLLTLV
ncbi:MAG: bacillithiol biosynthesis deacetylase BshB1 [Chitinophagales bacterium]